MFFGSDYRVCYGENIPIASLPATHESEVASDQTCTQVENEQECRNHSKILVEVDDLAGRLKGGVCKREY